MAGNGSVKILDNSTLIWSSRKDSGNGAAVDDSGIDSDPKQQTAHEDDKSFHASDSSCSSTTVATPQKSSAKQLHRKLEQRIEQAKKNHRLQEYKKNSSLIPIQRLPIPNKPGSSTQREQQPLVEWETDESDEDINFFPLSRMKDGKQELTDTFSIEDFDVSPDEDDLNLLPPKPMYQRCICCVIPADWKCNII
ncbi:protein FAM219A [Schistocerca americana]|uniref:protein FAM219A n=1 Tax=Schistocerca americana TaxID=7009 RepID=UPI001F4F3C39|nr:protein FAM219A [Schistocerca americana]XP_047118161.1 protein FAM219A [Schistocerca piceifrons]XP_049963825.1 protein FAM219A [Schistocerca serialis cubense]